MKISIFGNGYVGLVTGACLAEVGHQVLCMDVDLAKVKGLQQGEIPIYEPGLEEFVINNVAAGNLQFTSDLPTAIDASDLLFIAVGPPPDEDGSADLSHVLEVSRNIGKFMDREKLVVTKSTVPVGTSDQVLSAIKNELQHREVEFSIEVASSPEFLKEGAAFADFMKPDRIVVGATS